MARRDKPIVWHKKKSGFVPRSVLRPKRGLGGQAKENPGTAETAETGRERFMRSLERAVRRVIRGGAA